VETDPRLASLYDLDNPDGPDHDFWRQLAGEVRAKTIVDLGCGTGLLTVSLACDARRVIGIDPDAGMLAVARQRTGGEKVEWRLGDSRALGEISTDMVLMTCNVAQHIGPDDWARTLGDIFAVLAPGGLLGFETRNPTGEAWRGWTPELTRSIRSTQWGDLEEWMEVTEPDDTGTVLLTAHNLWLDTGEDLVVIQPLTFRSVEQIERDLAAAGFGIRALWGGWNNEPLAAGSPLIVVTAERSDRNLRA
jgi:SAM-dependent methyltransferase